MAKEKEKVAAVRTKTVSSKTSVTVTLRKDQILEQESVRYSPVRVVVRAISEKYGAEIGHKLYLNDRARKYNTREIFGIPMICVDEPNATENVSLHITIKVVK